MIHAVLPAYIDPMAGSLLAQSILAGVVGVLFMVRRQIGRFGGFLLGRGVKQHQTRS